jgi:hypothetical protein
MHPKTDLNGMASRIDAKDADFELSDPNALPAAQMIVAQQRALHAHFSRNVPLDLASFTLEMTLVARAAVADGQYGPAAKFYELVAKHIGAIDTKSDVHQHVHLHNQATQSDFARASDESLRQIIHEAKIARESREARDSTPTTTD